MGANREWELGKCLITSWAIRTQFEQISENENAWENGQVNTCVPHTHRHSHTASVIQFYLRVFWANNETQKQMTSFCRRCIRHTTTHTIDTIVTIYIHHTQCTIHTHVYPHTHMWFCGCGATKSFAYIFILCCELKQKLVMASLKEIINELVAKSHVCRYVCVCVSMCECVSLLLLAHTCLRALFHLCKWIISWKQ